MGYFVLRVSSDLSLFDLHKHNIINLPVHFIPNRDSGVKVGDSLSMEGERDGSKEGERDG